MEDIKAVGENPDSVLPKPTPSRKWNLHFFAPRKAVKGQGVLTLFRYHLDSFAACPNLCEIRLCILSKPNEDDPEGQQPRIWTKALLSLSRIKQSLKSLTLTVGGSHRSVEAPVWGYANDSQRMEVKKILSLVSGLTNLRTLCIDHCLLSAFDWSGGHKSFLRYLAPFLTHLSTLDILGQPKDHFEYRQPVSTEDIMHKTSLDGFSLFPKLTDLVLPAVKSGGTLVALECALTSAGCPTSSAPPNLQRLDLPFESMHEKLPPSVASLVAPTILPFAHSLRHLVLREPSVRTCLPGTLKALIEARESVLESIVIHHLYEQLYQYAHYIDQTTVSSDREFVQEEAKIYLDLLNQILQFRRDMTERSIRHTTDGRPSTRLERIDLIAPRFHDTCMFHSLTDLWLSHLRLQPNTYMPLSTWWPEWKLLDEDSLKVHGIVRTHLSYVLSEQSRTCKTQIDLTSAEWSPFSVRGSTFDQCMKCIYTSRTGWRPPVGEAIMVPDGRLCFDEWLPATNRDYRQSEYGCIAAPCRLEQQDFSPIFIFDERPKTDDTRGKESSITLFSIPRRRTTKDKTTNS